jgi:uncharacterized phage-associated protein/DNA-binding transcriptional regulator YiaG
MKSPFTGGEAILQKEVRSFEYRKDSFDVLYHYYVCNDTNEQFTTTDIDTLNINQVHNKYREKYGIPFVDEIKRIREQYDLSAAKMSEVLGLGTNIYRNYEGSEMPSVATGRLIRLAEDPKEFYKLLEISRNTFEPHEYERVKKKVDQRISGQGKSDGWIEHWLFGNKYPSILNGFRVPVVDRIGNMVRYFAYRNQPFTTALNKLMFYADFGHFKRYGHSISGLCYKALQKGPVPENYGGLYNTLVNSSYVDVEEADFGDFVGERFIAASSSLVDEVQALFLDTELEMLNMVSDKFKNMSTREIVDMSHEEPAWLNNIGFNGRISFDYGFDLINI